MKSEVHYCQYLVCMIDLLGQKEMYKVLESYQIGDKNSDFIEQLIKFIRVIESFKRDVDSFFDASEKYESKIKWPEHAHEFVEKTKKELCKIQRFSDGIMIYVPLVETNESFPVSSVLTALLCTASTMLTSLAKGNPVRAGIAIGGGVELEDGELFGPAIGYAHEMESERAIYPRIAVHENVISYLDSHTPPQEENISTINQQFEYEMARLCKAAIKLDNDGEFIIDYLGNAVWKYIFQGGDEELLSLSFNFVKGEKDQFDAEKNEKLISKYSYLYSYFVNSRHEIFKNA